MKYRLIFCGALAMALGACSGQNDVAEVKVTESAAAPAVAGDAGSSADRFGFNAKPAGQARAQAAFSGTKPESWTEAPASQMRMSNFTAGPEGAVEAYLSVLPGGAGGVEANLNRWRKQMSQAAYTPEEFAALEKVPVLGQEAVVADIPGTFAGMSNDQNKENYRMLGAILEYQGSTVFVKMVGPAEAVGAEKENFLAYVKSLQAGGGASPMAGMGLAAGGELPAGHPPIEGAPGAEAGAMPPGHPAVAPDAGIAAPQPTNLEWTLPAGWERGQDRPVRLANFSVGGSAETECFITVLPGDAGGLEANINLWRQQLGQAALTTAELDALPKVETLGSASPLVEVAGRYSDMKGELHDDYMLLGTICSLGDRSLFVKMVGPAAEVIPQKDNFTAFCQSLKLPASATPEAAPEAAATEPAPAAEPAPAESAPAAPEAAPETTPAAPAS